MKRKYKYSWLGQRGFYFISILIALVIIMILSGQYFRKGKQSSLDQQVSLYEHSMGRSKAAACQSNRRTLESQIEMWRVLHPSETPTLELLRRDGYSGSVCPEGGEYIITPEGQVICSKHGTSRASSQPRQ